MKQIKKNSKKRQGNGNQYQDNDRATLLLSGNLKVVESKNNSHTHTLYLDVNKRAISVEEEEISSISAKDLDSIVEQIQKKVMCNKSMRVLILDPEQNNSNKVLDVSNVKVVKRRGKNVLRMNSSVDNLKASGSYAENTLKNIKSNDDVRILCDPWTPYLCAY